MATRKNTARKARRPISADDWMVILTQFWEARCLLECVTRALKQLQDPADPSERGVDCAGEVVCLKHTQQQLENAYEELDWAIGRLPD